MFCVPCQVTLSSMCFWRYSRTALGQLRSKSTKVNASSVQHLTDADKVVRKEFCMQMFHRIQDDERLLDSVIFSDESMFHVSWQGQYPQQEHSASIIRIEEYAKQGSKTSRSLFATFSCSAFSWTLKMEAERSVETSVNLYRTTRCYTHLILLCRQ
jgi:hypothetical protein